MGSCKLLATSEDSLPQRNWQAIDASIDIERHQVTSAIPSKATVYYLNLFDERDCVVSTEHVEVEEK